MAKLQGLQRHKIPATRFREARDPAKAPAKRPDPDTSRNPPREATKAPPMRKDPADSEGRKPPSPKGGEYGDMSKGTVRKAGEKPTPEQAKKLASAMRGRPLP